MAILALGGVGYIGSHIVDWLVEAGRKVTRHPIPLEIADRRPGNPDTLVASSDKARQVLGWQPKFDNIEMIIETAWKWHSTHPNGYADWHWNPAGSLLDFYFLVIFSCNLFISAIIWKTLTFMLQLREQIKYIEVISWLLVIMDNGKKQDSKNWLWL